MNANISRAALAAALLPLFTMASLAHASLETKSAKAGTTYRAVLRIPHGCNGGPTNAVEVQIPEGFFLVKPMPHAGWTLSTQKADYAKTYTAHGKPFANGVVKITWSGGDLPDDWYDEFIFRGSLATDLAPGTMLYFPTVQTCPNGQNLWTAKQGEEGHPAPKLEILAAQTSHSAASDQMATMGAGKDLNGAHATVLGDLTLKAAWVRATPPNAPTGGGFLTIANKGDQPDQLISVSTPVAKTSEIHEMRMNGNVMEMRALPEGVQIPAHGEITLKPGATHLMLMGLKSRLTPGQTIAVTLTFKKAGTVTLDMPVLTPDQAPKEAAGGMQDMPGMGN